MARAGRGGAPRAAALSGAAPAAGDTPFAGGDTPLAGSDTIVALSSGAPPAAIAVLRVSGPAALAAAAALAGPLPPPRHAALRALRNGGELLDRALVLVFPVPASATGEDVVELHCHGGRAVVAAVEAALAAHPGVRRAEPGEFTRRALGNGRIDLAQAQGLADLLAADSEAERRLAIRAADGETGRTVRGWLAELTATAAVLEAAIDHDGEGEAPGAAALAADAGQARVAAAIRAALAQPPVERWREGWRVVVAGPPNAGKSSLVNALAGREAAITAPVAGTTRDRLEVAVTRGGVGYLLTDTAGLRDDAADPVEVIGVARAREAAAAADLVLWLGDDAPPAGALWVHARADLPGRAALPPGRELAVAAGDPALVAGVWAAIAARIAPLPPPGVVPLHRRERDACARALALLEEEADDAVLAAEALRGARRELGAVLGIDATEQLLDELFGRFCLGK